MLIADFLTEGVQDAYLFHATPVNRVMAILRDNRLEANTALRTHRDKRDPDGAPHGVSLTRSYHVAFAWKENASRKVPVVLVLDGARLKRDHPMAPHDFFLGWGSRGGSEAEEFVTGAIRNLDAYLVSINVQTKHMDRLSPQELATLAANPKLNAWVPALYRNAYGPVPADLLSTGWTPARRREFQTALDALAAKHGATVEYRPDPHHPERMVHLTVTTTTGDGWVGLGFIKDFLKKQKAKISGSGNNREEYSFRDDRQVSLSLNR